MDAQKKNLSRRAILLQLQAAYPAAVSDEILAQGLKVSGVELDGGRFFADIEYLAGLGLLERVSSFISAGFKRSRLTSKGVSFLESEGF